MRLPVLLIWLGARSSSTRVPSTSRNVLAGDLVTLTSVVAMRIFVSVGRPGVTMGSTSSKSCESGDIQVRRPQWNATFAPGEPNSLLVTSTDRTH